MASRRPAPDERGVKVPSPPLAVRNMAAAIALARQEGRPDGLGAVRAWQRDHARMWCEQHGCWRPRLACAAERDEFACGAPVMAPPAD